MYFCIGADNNSVRGVAGVDVPGGGPDSGQAAVGVPVRYCIHIRRPPSVRAFR